VSLLVVTPAEMYDLCQRRPKYSNSI